MIVNAKPPARAFVSTLRKPIALAEDALVHGAPLRADCRLPLLVTPGVPGVDLAAWAAEHRGWIDSMLLVHGGLLFRGFGVDTAERFEQVVLAVSGTTLAYNERSSPRTQINSNIYTSTDYPPDQHIFLHNENSYQQTWPSRIYFFCETPALEGGETPIADCRRVYEAIEPRVRDTFASKGWMYTRNFSERLGLPWQTVFQTTDRSAVDAYCASHGIEAEWLDGNRLRTRARRAAIVRHPKTGDWLWFNHAVFFHVSTLHASVRDLLLAEYDEPDLPANTYYGDGTPIAADTLEMLRAAYKHGTVAFPWERRDVLLVDNMLTAHGRAPFSGPRRVLVAMAEPVSAATPPTLG
jgi:alpha-ketoglutarate-dependent taurine dioxygenase